MWGKVLYYDFRTFCAASFLYILPGFSMEEDTAFSEEEVRIRSFKDCPTKKFKKQHIEVATANEIVRCVSDDEISDDVRFIGPSIPVMMTEYELGLQRPYVSLPFYPLGIHKSNPNLKHLVRIENKKTAIVWFEPVFRAPSEGAKAEMLKEPVRSVDAVSSVSFDLFASLWDLKPVIVPSKTFKQIGTGYTMRIEKEPKIDPRVQGQPLNWYGRIVATKAQDIQGILHGSAPYDPKQADGNSPFHEIVVTLFNFNDRPYKILPNDCIGRLVLSPCFTPVS
jgi:hypothetical protein